MGDRAGFHGPGRPIGGASGAESTSEHSHTLRVYTSVQLGSRDGLDMSGDVYSDFCAMWHVCVLCSSELLNSGQTGS